MNDAPPCPWCKTSRKVYPHGDRNFQCLECKRIFDAVDDGDASYGPPSRRIEREEREQERRKNKLKRMLT